MIHAPTSAAHHLISLLHRLPASAKFDDFVLASYPKSGNTWFRFVFANLKSNRTQDKVKVNFHNIENFSPAVGSKLELSYCPLALDDPYGVARPIKTHYVWSLRYARRRSVLLVRDPQKCLPAYLDYLTEAHGLAFPDMTNFLNSWRYGLPGWGSFHRSWMSRTKFVLRYEDLLANPEHWIGSIVDHFGLQYDRDEIAIAIDQSSRLDMKQAEAEGDPYHDAGYTFVRGEGVKRRNVALSPEDRARIEAHASPLFRSFRSGPV